MAVKEAEAEAKAAKLAKKSEEAARLFANSAKGKAFEDAGIRFA